MHITGDLCGMQEAPPQTHSLQMFLLIVPPLWFCQCGKSFPKRILFIAHLEEMNQEPAK